MMKVIYTIAAVGILFTNAPAFAQNEGSQNDEGEVSGRGVFDGDWLTVGIGAGYAPSYEGSDDYVVFPAPVAQGSVSGFEFGARGPGFYVDLIRDSDNKNRIKLLAGPVFRVRLDRNDNIRDAAVRTLGKRDVAIEVGATAGLSVTRLLNPFDTLSVSADVQWDVADAHGGRLITPSISYSTPLSPSIFTSLSVSATHIDDDYAATYFSIDPAGSIVSGLPVFSADGGWKSYGATLLSGLDLSGDARDGGWSLFGIASYSRLRGDAKLSPVTSNRGNANQWFLASGISYTF